MLRQRLVDELKVAMKSRDQRSISTLRLILAALKDRDIAARTRGSGQGVDEAEIIEMMQKMVRQRQESIALYRQGNRPELVAQEEGEIAVIERFMPKKLDPEETEAAIAAVIKELDAKSIKDMGRVMARLKEKFSGRMDFGSIGPHVKQRLS
jgi:uncharacterized protein YqeY